MEIKSTVFTLNTDNAPALDDFGGSYYCDC